MLMNLFTSTVILIFKIWDAIVQVFSITFDRYDKGWYQLGLSCGYHDHDDLEVKWHFHLWIDLGPWYIEVRIGED
jgi:hypothetical protein